MTNPSIVGETKQRLTWRDLVREEPALAELERDIRAVKADPGTEFCASAAWYGYRAPGFKSRLLGLVGWHARNPKVRSAAAYDRAYDHLHRLLPDCQHEGPFC